MDTVGGDYDPEVREEIQILTIVKFTSKRKRMSVIIRDTDGRVKLLIKGADTTMIPISARSLGDQKVETTSDNRKIKARTAHF